MLGFSTRIRASDDAHPPGKILSTSPLSTKGTHHVVALFAKFKDEAPGVVRPPEYARTLFDPEVEGSFSHFYRTMSRGALTIKGTCPEKMYASEKPPSEYSATGYESAFGPFNLEILRKADEDLDFGEYDNDGPDGIPNSGDDDGYVDFVFINLLSIPEHFILQKATGIVSLGLSEPFRTNDAGGKFGSIWIWDGSTQLATNFHYTVGVMAHEYGHALGLPDLYDTSFLSPSDQPIADDGAGIGRWGLMGRGSLGWDGILSPFCAWSLAQLGWVEVIEISGDTLGVEIEEIGAGGKVYKVPIDGEEYFLLEHRKASGRAYDREQPADGLLIWHIDERGDNGNEHHKRVDLECADGLFFDKGYPAGIVPDSNYGMDNLDFWAHGDAYQSRHAGNEGDATDVFDGVRYTAFSYRTNPSSNGYSKFPGETGQTRGTGIGITHIRPRGAAMVADFAVKHWTGSIVGYTVWSDTVRVFGDITVEEGAILALDPGTQVRFQPSDELRSGANPDRIELIVRGTVRARTEAVVSRVLLAPSKEEAPWFGIRLEGNSAELDLEDVTLVGSLYGIVGNQGRANVALKYVGINESVYDAIRLEEWDGSVELADSWLSRCGGNGIVFFGSGTLALVRSSVMNMGATGICLEGPTLALSFSSVYENAGDGIHLLDWEGKTEIRNSSLQNNGGVGLRAVGGEVLKVEGLETKANAEGAIRIEDTFLECDGAVLSGNDAGFGLRALRVSGSVTGTIFEHHETAVWASSSPLTFSGNTFRNNANALLCDASPLPMFSPFNVLWENLHSVRNTAPEGLRAENNWWGTAESSEIQTRIEGNVQWRPFLVSDPTGKDRFVLNPNFPNPFDACTILPFQVPMDRGQFGDRVHVAVTIYNGSGQRVRTLLNRLLEPGYYAPIWDGRDERGRRTGSGIYVYKVALYDSEGKEVAALSARMVQIK
ncbi:MAG: right-handed parallel beta-helix repeat-containing protein [Candidatus Latescibacteria bacterium]|nr:right-handed parallel beta-helix repeat-containing protein [Candidatus Latescibacterota bacterium]